MNSNRNILCRYLLNCSVLAAGLILFLHIPLAYAQEFDLLIRNGHVIDPGNNINAVIDVAVKDGKIARVARDIPSSQSAKVVDAQGFLVTPGLINLHSHVFVGSKANTFADGVLSVSPDDFTFKSGITTIVDAGTSGWQSFPVFKKQVIDQSQTRILAFLSVFGSGMTGGPGLVGFPGLEDINTRMTLSMATRFPGTIVGIAVGHYNGPGWTPFESAMEVTEQVKIPVFVECLLPQLPLQEILGRMRPGDILTHAFENVAERKPVPNDVRTPVVNAKGLVEPFVFEAKKRGILFDVGHGGAGFWFSQAVPAFKQGLLPDSFGMDLHRFSMNAGMKDMLNIMSKYLTMGMSVEDIIARATWLPAKAIKQEGLGNLSIGSVADIAVISIQKGSYGFIDAGGYKINGDRKFQAELTVRAGKIVWDLNGISAGKYQE